MHSGSGSGLFLFSLFALLLVGSSYCDDFSISIDRYVDLSSQVVNEETYYEVKNTGTAPQASFLIALPTKDLSHWAVYQARSSSKGDSEELSAIKKEVVGQESHHGLSYDMIKVSFKSDLPASRKAFIKVVTEYTHQLIPRPSSMTQEEFQKVIYEANHFIASPYTTTSQVTTIYCLQIVSHSDYELPTTSDDQKIEYGSYNNVPAWSYSQSSVHCYNAGDFIVVDHLIREIEVSHWGNIAVEEMYELHHGGTKLKGKFSRLDEMMGKVGNSVQVFLQDLPQGAFDVYYRDIIGNISSSNVFPHESSVLFEIRPRFVMFGGWKNEFKTGYNLATPRYLAVDGDEFVLSVPVVNTFRGAVVDDLEIRVVLPEGAYDTIISTDLSVSETKYSERKTYLDTSGRVVLTFSSKNLISSHNDHTLVVRYKLAAFTTLREPFFLIASFALFFSFIILYYRSNFNLHDNVTENEERDEKVIALAGEYFQILEGRETKYQEKDGGSVLPKKLKKYNMDMEASFTASQAIIAKIGSSDPELVRHIQMVEEYSKQKSSSFRKLLSAKSQPALAKKMSQEFSAASGVLVNELSSLRSLLA